MSKQVKYFLYIAVIGVFLLPVLGFLGARGHLDPAFEPFTGEFESPEIDLSLWQVDDGGTCNFLRSDQVVRSGGFSLRIDSEAGGRCEVLPWPGTTMLGRLQREPFDKDRWYAFSIYLPGDWELSERNEVLAQWHSSKDVFFGEKGGRGPPLALRIVGDEWRVTAGSDSKLISADGAKAGEVIASGPIEPGTWSDWVFHVHWSWTETGVTRVWRNGILVADRTGPNAYRDLRGVYLKLGSYHPGRDRTLFLDRVLVQSAPLDAKTADGD